MHQSNQKYKEEMLKIKNLWFVKCITMKRNKILNQTLIYNVSKIKNNNCKKQQSKILKEYKRSKTISENNYYKLKHKNYKESKMHLKDYHLYQMKMVMT